MKAWMKKLLDQLATDDASPSKTEPPPSNEMSEDRATILFIMDTYNKHLIETEKNPARKARETLDMFARNLVHSDTMAAEEVLFKFRQWFASHRIDEYGYIQSTFDDFKKIIWDFADQLSEDVREEQTQDEKLKSSLGQLREAVEANSIDTLRSKSREFINFYIDTQSRKDERKAKRLKTVRSNLNSVKKKLTEINQAIRMDHLTGAFNRKSFDEQIQHSLSMFTLSQVPVTLLTMDIDFFKKINDCYGHKIGDDVLKECVKMLKEVFNREEDFVARIGGEEFAVVLPDVKMDEAVKKAEEALNRIRRETLLIDKFEVKFTISIGLAELLQNESVDQWMKRADAALYYSKNHGRDKLTIAPSLVSAA